MRISEIEPDYAMFSRQRIGRIEPGDAVYIKADAEYVPGDLVTVGRDGDDVHVKLMLYDAFIPAQGFKVYGKVLFFVGKVVEDGT